MNRLLLYQLERLGLFADEVPDLHAWRDLLEQVDAVYEQADQDRMLVERSMERSSEHMKALDAQLVESDARYRSLFEGSSSPMWLWELSSRRFVEVNDAAVSLYGYSREEFLSMKIEDIWPEQERKAVLDRVATIASSQVHGERRHIKKDGNSIFVGVSARSLVVGDRELVFTVVQDLTEQRRLQDQLLQSQKMEAIGRLAGGIAHDFNNILAVVLADAEWIATELGTDHPLATIAFGVVNAAERGGALTKQLLAFSRRQAWEPKAMSLGRVVAEMERMLQRLIGEDVRLSYTGDDRVMIDADRSQVEQIVLNLVVNARDAMPKGGKVTVSVKEVALEADRNGVPAGRYAVLSVTDTGCGMDAATIARVFEPFFTTKAPGRGTGLGLSTVFGIVRQSDGRVVVRSEVGQGSTFEIYLPVSKQAPPPAVKIRSSLPPAGGTVLVVEDDDDVRRVVCRTLRNAGYEVLEKSSATQALEVVDDPDAAIRLVLTDVIMPGMSGIELRERVRAKRPSTPVVLMSGYNDQITQLESAGMLLRKPFTPKLLRRTVGEALGLEDPEAVKA